MQQIRRLSAPFSFAYHIMSYSQKLLHNANQLLLKECDHNSGAQYLSIETIYIGMSMYRQYY